MYREIAFLSLLIFNHGSTNFTHSEQFYSLCIIIRWKAFFFSSTFFSFTKLFLKPRKYFIINSLTFKSGAHVSVFEFAENFCRVPLNKLSYFATSCFGAKNTLTLFHSFFRFSCSAFTRI